MPPFLRGMRAAAFFITRVPVGGYPYSPADWQWSSAHFPLVGAFLGFATAVVFRALSPLGPLPAALLALGASMMLTGAFHEDGLADTSDALGGGYTKEKVLLILKDSRIGTFGGAALVISIGARAAMIAQLGTSAFWVLPLVGCLARVGPIWQMVALPYVTSDGASKQREVHRATMPQALTATTWLGATVAIVWLAKHAPLVRIGVATAICFVVTWFLAYRFLRRTGGITGDFLGATEQLCELAALGAIVWGAR